MENRKPAKGRVIVRKIEMERKTESGIILANDTEVSATEKAVILAVGECNQPFTIGDACYVQRGGCIDIGFGDWVCVENEILYSEPL